QSRLPHHPKDDFDLALESTKTDLMSVWIRQQDGRLARIINDYGSGSREAEEFVEVYEKDAAQLLVDPLGLITRVSSQPVNEIANFNDEVMVENTGPKECVGCSEEMDSKNLYKVTPRCSHTYCKPCLQAAYALALKEKTLQPLKCCQMPFELTIETTVVFANNLKELSKIRYLREELEEISKDTSEKLLYCPDTNCAEYVPLEHRNADTNIASCPVCWKAFCMSCCSDPHASTSPCSTKKRDLEEETKRNSREWKNLCRDFGYKMCPNEKCG
ncbi:hypothetical protein HDV05_002608, partial [Chytridiales sp. JEL 0842]